MNTEITLPAAELKQALPGLNKIISKKTTLPVLSHVRVSRNSNGVVTLQGTDLDAHATYTVNGNQPGKSLDVLVPLEQLNKAFKCSTSKQDVGLVCEGKSTKLRYFIGGNPMEQPVNTLPVDEWPPVPEIKVDSTALPAGFGEALKQAMECCSDDPSRQVLHGACLDARDHKAHYIIGTNGRFLYSANSFSFPIKDTLIVPDSKFINGAGLLDNEPCFLAVQPGKKPSQVKHICFQNKQWQFVTREIEGKYPNWKQVMPAINSSWTLIQLSPSAIEQLLTVIPNLPGYDNNTNTIRLRTGHNALWVEGRNKDDAESTKIAISDVTITGKAKEISLNRDYLLPALKFGLNALHVLDELSPMVCSKDGKRMVIMPVRPPNASEKPTEAPKPADPTQSAAPSKPAVPSTTNKPTERNAMPRIAKTPVPSAPTAENNGSTVKELLGQVEQIKENLKSVFGDLTTVTGKLKALDKEKRTTQKEVEGVRKQLRRIQTVTI